MRVLAALAAKVAWEEHNKNLTFEDVFPETHPKSCWWCEKNEELLREIFGEELSVS